MIPPSFATVSSVNSPAEIFPLDQSDQAKTGARVSINNLAGSPISEPTLVNLIATLDSGSSPLIGKVKQVRPYDWRFMLILEIR